MIPIRTVLCSVDLSPDPTGQVQLAADLCRSFNARLVLHHNAVELAIGSGVGWMWAVDHQNAGEAAERTLRDLLARVPEGVTVEARLTHGPVADAVSRVADAVDADLVVVNTHGTVDEHGSVTSRLLAQGTRSVFALQGGSAAGDPAVFTRNTDTDQVLVVPTDLTPTSAAATELAFELARHLRIRVHLLHVLPDRVTKATGTPGDPAEEARGRMLLLVPPDISGRVDIHVERGDAADAIARLARQLSAACIVMGEHRHAPLRHWFHPDTPRAVLERAPCSIWYVPAAKAA